MVQKKSLAIGIVVAGILLSGCTSKLANKTEFSGFLPDYSKLQEVQTPTGQTVLRWVDPSFDPKNYSHVYFEPVVFYPAPKPTEQITEQTLDNILAYTNSQLKSAIGQRIPLASTPGPRTLIFKGAITGVSSQSEGLQFYEVIPVALVVAGTMAATGHRTRETQLFFEGQLIDASTGKPVVSVVRKGFGRNLSNAEQKLKLEDFRQVIDNMSKDAALYTN